MKLIVLNECDADLAFRLDLEDIASEVQDAVQEVTGLPLPPIVHLRLVSLRRFLRANRVATDTMFNLLEENFPDLPSQMVKTARVLAGSLSRVTTRMSWRRLGAQFLPVADATIPQILLMPKVAKISRANHWELRLTLAHKLIHVAQFHANPRLTLEVMAQAVGLLGHTRKQAKERKKQLAQFGPVLEGHAQWAAWDVVSRIYGRDVHDKDIRFDGKGTVLFRLAKQVNKRNPVFAAKAGQYDSGEAFLQEVYDHGGLELVNRMWTGIETLPTEPELEFPAGWIARMSRRDEE